MADNIALADFTGTSRTVAAKEVGSVLFMRHAFSVWTGSAFSDLTFGRAAATASIPVALDSTHIVTEDAAAAANPIGEHLMARRRDTLSGSEVSADGDSIALNATSKGELCVSIADALTVTTITGGGVAHDATDAGNPLKVGGRATNVNLAAVANNDRSDLITDLTGKLVIQPYSVPEVSIDGTASSTGTGDTEVIAAQGSGVRIYVTTLILANNSATPVLVTIKSGSTGKLVIPVPANTSGAVVTLPKALRLAANQALNFASSSGVSTVYCSAVGYAAP